MHFILSRYNHDLSWVSEYPGTYYIYDRSEVPLEHTKAVPNIGTDIYDKFTYIIDHYDNLPDVAVYSKANIFKYITKEEFDKVKDNTTFTPLFTKTHKETTIDLRDTLDYIKKNNLESAVNPVLEKLFLREPWVRKMSFYDDDGIYNELNNFWYFGNTVAIERVQELAELLGIWGEEYVKFSPGSNYILPKENILKHPKEFYAKLRSYLSHEVYPKEAFLVERGLYNIWK